MNILVGTTNRNKVRSVQRYLQAYDVQLVTPQDVRLHVRDVYKRQSYMSINVRQRLA